MRFIRNRLVLSDPNVLKIEVLSLMGLVLPYPTDILAVHKMSVMHHPEIIMAACVPPAALLLAALMQYIVNHQSKRN